MWVSPLFSAVRRWWWWWWWRLGDGIKASEPGCYLGLTEELSQIKEEVVKVV